MLMGETALVHYEIEPTITTHYKINICNMKFLLLASLLSSMTMTLHANPISVKCNDLRSSEIRTLASTKDYARLKQTQMSAVTLPATPCAPTEAPAPITDIPSGKTVNYSRNSDVYMNVLGEVAMDYDSGHSANIVTCDNGDVYIETPFAAAYINGYLKGSKDSDGNIIAQLPQCVVEDYYGEITEYFIYAMKYDSDMMTYLPDENQEIRYVYDELTEGFSLMKSDKEVTYMSPAEMIIGFVGENGNWVGYGEFNQEWTPFKGVVATVPDNLKENDWIFSYWRTKNYDLSETKGLIKGYDDGEGNYYFKGIYKNIPDAVVAAHIESDSIVFPSKQYLGVSEGYHTFFMGGSHWREYDSYWDYWDDLYELMPEVRLGINEDHRQIFDSYEGSPKEAAKLTPKCFIVNAGTDRLFEMQICRLPEFQYQPSDISLIPMNPVILDFVGFEENYDEYCLVDFELPAENIDEYLLDDAKMYYNFIDRQGNIVPVTQEDLGGEDYSCLTEPLTDIPYNLDVDTGIYNDGSFHVIYLYDKKFESCGIQSCIVVDGHTYKSDVVYLSGDSGVKDTFSDIHSSETRFYNIHGMEIDNPTDGIFLKVQRNPNGRIDRKKIIR